MKRALALSLALVLCLCGCAAMLEREYTTSNPHEEGLPPHGEAAYRVETYPALRSALLSYVEEGMTEGLLRFPTTYAGNLTVDLEKARRQLMEEEPLGCYGLSDLTYRTSKIIAYYEVDLTFTYKVDRDQLISLPKVRSQAELARLLQETMAREDTALRVYLTACPEDDADFLGGAVAAAWAALKGEEDPPPSDEPDLPPETQAPEAPEDPETPDSPSDLPQLTAEFYPQTGARRVAVLDIAYPQPQEPAPDGEGGEP